MKPPADGQGRRLMGVGRNVREWAREVRGRNRLMATALEDFAASLEQRARLMHLLSYSPVGHDDAPYRS